MFDWDNREVAATSGRKNSMTVCRQTHLRVEKLVDRL